MTRPRRQITPRKPAPRPLLTWLIILSLGLIPLILTLLITLAAAIASRNGVTPFVDHFLGPLCLIGAGWTFAGAILGAYLFGSLLILQGKRGLSLSLSLFLAWSLVIGVFAMGIGLIILGVWLMLARHP